MTDLNRSLIDIALSTGRLEIICVGPGPNSWDEVGPEDFGPEHDFEVENHGSIFIFTPISEAGKQWCYSHLPEDCPRWGLLGFVIEHRFIADIVAGARRDCLMSMSDYTDAMNHEQDNQRG